MLLLVYACDDELGVSRCQENETKLNNREGISGDHSISGSEGRRLSGASSQHAAVNKGEMGQACLHWKPNDVNPVQ